MYAFVESKTKRVYVLNPQNQAAPFAGRAVVVKGTMDTATITITASSITAGTNKARQVISKWNIRISVMRGRICCP